MTAKMTRSAELRASSFNEADNSVEVVWTTGATVRRRDWRSDRPYQEVLEVTPEAVRLDRLNAGASFLNSHDSGSLASVIGTVVPGSAKIEGGKGIARIRLSNSPGDADVVAKIRDSIIRNVSVGYAIHRVEKTESDTDEDDVWRVIDWEPFEISAVAVPADHGSQIRDHASTDAGIEFVEPATRIGDLEDDISDALRVASLAIAVRTTDDTAISLADFAYDIQFAKSRSSQLAGVAFGAAMVLAGGHAALARALASDAGEDDEEADDSANAFVGILPSHRNFR